MKRKENCYHLISYQPEAMTNDFLLYNFLDFFLSKHTSLVWGTNSVNLVYSIIASVLYAHIKGKLYSTLIPPRKLEASSVLGVILIANSNQKLEHQEVPGPIALAQLYAVSRKTVLQESCLTKSAPHIRPQRCQGQVPRSQQVS